MPSASGTGGRGNVLAEALFGTDIPSGIVSSCIIFSCLKAGYFGNNRYATAFVLLVAAKMVVKETNTEEEFLSRSFFFYYSGASISIT